MTPHFFRARLWACTAIFGITLTTPLAAQTSRPGSATRPNVSSGSRAGANRIGSGGGQTRSLGGPRQYRSNTELGDAVITVDPETRSLVIVTDEATHNELSKVIAQLDKPKPQVLIKVVFLEVTHNKDSDIGVEGTYTYKLKGPQINGVSQNVAAQSALGLAALTEGSFIRLATDDWSATLRAIAANGKVEILSRPSILARNNQEAVIVVGQEVPFITNSRITDNGQTINTVQYDNVGIILRVTPFITSEGTVEMIVAPEISTLTDKTVAISDKANSPIIAKRSAETVVVTPNAKTVVIGGLMETRKIESIRKVPILGDIPVLGFPFKRTVKSDVKKELMIFLTPYIVRDPKRMENLAAGELKKTELVPEAFNPDDFGKYLDNPSLFPGPLEPAAPLPVRRATAAKPAGLPTTAKPQAEKTGPVPRKN
jgi:general secretion pathway protein D